MKKILYVVCILLMGSFSLASGENGEELFQRKCSKCHAYERALNKSKDLAAWKRTTLRMARYSRGEITSEDAEHIAQYLAGRTTEEKPGTISRAEKEIKDIDEMEKHKIFDFKKVRIEQFIGPDVCEECHSEIFEQWSGSMHSKAFVDPLWRSATKLFFKDATKSGEILEMFCNWCHNISEVKHLGDAGYEVAPGGGEENPSTMLGPFKDADSPYHPSKYSELHTKSEFCGLCHNVSHAANNLPIEETYNEWKNSPYNTGNPETTVHCQDCHMRQRPGIPSTGKTERPDNPGQACDDGPERQHIWTHYFVGANAVITKLFGSETHAKMAVERLQNAADLELVKDSSYQKNRLAHIKVKVINSGAGHYLPTGLTEVRQMWLDVKITDARGRVLLRSGNINEEGDVDENAVMYQTHLGDEKGNLVLNVAKADRILYDNRIPPKGYVIEKFAFYIPDDAVAPLKIETTLKYRSASQSLANVLLGDNAPEIPAIDMISITENIIF
jgi:mono/diheme cytochrome c family protein